MKNYHKDYHKEYDIDTQLEQLKTLFDYQIQVRGQHYYEEGRVQTCIRSNNNIYARVGGSSHNTYEVSIEEKYGHFTFHCNCPCEFPCKHIYATIIATLRHNYTNKKIMPSITKKEESISQIIAKIPAEELKKYILSEYGKDYVAFELTSFNKHFANYLPKQSYHYYYNQLYNSLVLDGFNNELLAKYLEKIRINIMANEYNESFLIIKAIIESLHDTHLLNKCDYILSNMPFLGTSLRIIQRKGLHKQQNELNSWLNQLAGNNYYQNHYLEDIICSLNYQSDTITIDDINQAFSTEDIPF